MSEFENLATTFQVTQDALLRHSARAVDSALVVRNWLFGWYLVEFENASASRADLYGKELISKLAKRLKEKGLRGVSPTNLRKFREFFQAYPEIQRATSVTSLALLGSPSFLQDSAPTEKIQQTLSVESFQSMWQATFTQIASSLPLGWSHYVELLTLEDPPERSFYEIEAASEPMERARAPAPNRQFFFLCGAPHKGKNWLFFGEAGAGERGAILYTVIESCRRRGIDPYAYLKDVLTRLPSMTNRQLVVLLPANWGRMHTPALRAAA